MTMPAGFSCRHCAIIRRRRRRSLARFILMTSWNDRSLVIACNERSLPAPARLRSRAGSRHEPVTGSCRCRGTPRLSSSASFKARHAVIGATLAFVVGGAVVAPSFSAARERCGCTPATLADLEEGTPMPITLRVARPDGAERSDRPARSSTSSRPATSVRALDSTCTHLGCRTRFNAETQADRVPVPRRRLRRARAT